MTTAPLPDPALDQVIIPDELLSPDPDLEKRSPFEGGQTATGHHERPRRFRRGVHPVTGVYPVENDRRRMVRAPISGVDFGLVTGRAVGGPRLAMLVPTSGMRRINPAVRPGSEDADDDDVT